MYLLAFFDVAISGQILRIPLVPEVCRCLFHCHNNYLLVLDGSMHSRYGSLASLLELSKYHYKQAKRLLHWYLWWNRIGPGYIHVLDVN